MRKTLWDWLDDRTNYRQTLARWRERTLPRGPSWGHATASCLLWLMVVEVVTGLLLMMTYSPSSSSAWASVHFIDHSPGGAFIRGLHHYTTQAILILLGIHLMRVLVSATFRAPRELIWLTGLLLMPLVVIWAITGNPLAGTQKGAAQIEVEGNIIASTPLVGPTLQRILIGGTQVGHLTFTHLYFLHVGLMPLVVLSLLAVHLRQVMRHGVSLSEPAGADLPARPYFPYQTIRNLTVLTLVLGIVSFISWRQGAPLDAPADPTLAHIPRPEWYFLCLFELRRYFAGDWEFVATIVIPLAVLAGLAAMPLFDRFCSRRMSSVLRWLTVISGAGAWAALTLIAVSRDRNDPNYQAASRNMAALSARAQELAAEQAIRPEGAVSLLREDAKTQGPLLFAKHCAHCHSHLDEAGRGIAAAQPSAPNLYGFASRRWLTNLFDPQKIATHEYFGNTGFAKGEMVRTVRRAFAEAAESDETGVLRERLQQVAAAISAEAKLPAHGSAEPATADEVAKGRELLIGEFGCVECHRFHDDGDLGAAPDLTGYGSRDWLMGMIGDPQAERFYGEEHNDRMPSFAKDSAHPQNNLLNPRELELLVDWLRGEWRADGIILETGRSGLP